MVAQKTILLLSLVVVSSTLLVTKLDPIDWLRDREIRAPIKAPEVPKAEKTIFEKIAIAESISDPLERCKAIPLPQEFSWPKATIDAFCVDLNTPLIGWNEIQSMIEKGSGRLLDARFDRMVSGYFSGTLSEGALSFAYYNNFDGTSSLGTRLIQQWLKASPKSPHALTASGLMHIASAWQFRGGKFFKDTPSPQLSKMREEVAVGLTDLKMAIAINPRIIPAYQAIMSGARLIGDRSLADRYLAEVKKIDPNNYYVLYEYESILEPRWGGSLQELDAIAEVAERLNSNNPRMINLIAETKSYPSYGVEEKLNDKERYAILHEASAAGPLSTTLERYAAVCSILGKHLQSYEIYTQVLRHRPNEVNYLYRRADEAIALKGYTYAKKDIDTARRIDPTNAFALRLDAYLDILGNNYKSAQPKLQLLMTIDPSDDWSIEQIAWISIFRTQNKELAREMIDRGLAMSPQKGSFHWLNWELIRRAYPEKLSPEITNDFITHADKTDPRQVDALQYTK